MSAKGKRTPTKRANFAQNSESEDEELDFGEEDGGYRIGDIYIPPPPPPPKYSGNSTGRRLIITQIENINFKSYAGRQVLGPFHKSFTSIVGPNGSGKSNVIDSMLFVFGYRAQKLRSKKLSVLIHNSDTFPNVQSCKVIVHFAEINDQGGDDFELIPGSEFTVSRSINKENVSIYTIDDRKVQFKEVSQRLQSFGIDLRYNRFLILQGEVEQIALMKPKAETEHETGMLEFLEDIIGSTRLKKPLGELHEMVEKANVVRAEKLNRVKVVEKEKNVLEEARNEAVLFLETENELTRKRSILFQSQKSEAVEERDEALKEFEKANVVFKEAEAKIDELKKSRSEKENEIKQWNEKLTDVSKQAEEYQEAFNEIERRDVQTRNKIKHTKEKGKKLTSELENERKKLEELSEIPEKCRKESEELMKRKSTLEEEKKKADDDLSKANSLIEKDIEPLRQQKDEHEAELHKLKKGVNEARSKLEVEQSKLDLYIGREKTEQAKLEQLKLKYERNAEELRQKKGSLFELEKRIPSAEARVKNITNEVFQLQEQRNRITEQFRKNSEKLEEAKNALHADTSRNAVLSALMEQKRLCKLKGILGRLGDLGAIDPKYDVAISTACGALDNMVTDTMDNAQQCVKFLKSNNIGASTFIALDKMQRWESHSRSTIQTPENVPRLFDLVRVTDERVLPAFYFALRDTLVADNLTQATRIGLQGKKRWRVVTLKGELVEISGAMSGGGRPSSGRMGSSVRASETPKEELKELESNVASLRNELSEIKSKQDFLNVEGEKLCSDIEIMKQNIPKFKLDISEMAKQQDVLKQSIEQQERAVKESAPDPKKVKLMEKEVENLNQDYEKNLSFAEKVEAKIKELKRKMDDIIENNVGIAKRKVESLKTEFEKVTSAVTKANVSEKTALRNIDKCNAKIESINTEITESETLIETLKEEMKKMEKEAQEINEKYLSFTEQKDEIQTKMREISQEVNKLKKKETQLNSDNLDVKHEVEKLENILKEREVEVKKWDAKIATLKLHEIDDKPAQEPLPTLSKEELKTFNAHSVKKEIENLEKELKKMKPNMAAIEEYRKKQNIYLERVKELEESTAERDRCKETFENLKAQRLKEFKDGFTIITRKLKEMYRTITLGGDAELEWIDSLDPFSEGINFAVRPNKKSWKRISNLSGGEKTLSSLALIFALHYYKPSPLYVMDEIDAALDFRNVSIVAHYIKQRTRNTQFIIISLRSQMYELADRLVGIYKTFNCTKSVTINPSCIEAHRRKTIDISEEAQSSNEARAV